MTRPAIGRCVDCRRVLVERRPWRDDEGRLVCDRCVGERRNPWLVLMRDPAFVAGMARAQAEHDAVEFQPFRGKR